MKEKGFSTFLFLLIVLALHGAILTFIFSTGLFLRTSLYREWMAKSRNFQEGCIKKVMEEFIKKLSEEEDFQKIFELKIIERGKDENLFFETNLELEELEQSQNFVPFKFLIKTKTWKGRYESKSTIEGKGKVFKGRLPFSLFPLLSESVDSEIEVISPLLPKNKFIPSSLAFSLLINEELREKIKESGEGIFYFHSLEEPVLFINQDAEKIVFSKELNSQLIKLESRGKEVSLKIDKYGAVFQNFDGTLINSKPCKLILVNGKINLIYSTEKSVLIPGLDLTIISSDSIKIENSLEGENSLVGICSTGIDIVNGEEKEGLIKISQNASSVCVSLFSGGRIDLEGDLIIKGSLQCKNLNSKNLKIIAQGYLLSGKSPSFYPITSEEKIFIGKLEINEWREE
ncbi:MAG: hypothetical protein ACUVUG_08690 [Candidatus Aminicenantia bacterium]